MVTTLPIHFVAASGIAGALWTSELPLPVPPVLVDALWCQALDAQPAHQWLRAAVARASVRSLAEA